MAQYTKRIQQLPLLERRGFDAIFNGSYISDIPAQLAEWKCTRVLLVVSKTLDSSTPYILKWESRIGSLIISKKVGLGAHSL
jgi:hypothetical protein